MVGKKTKMIFTTPCRYLSISPLHQHHRTQREVKRKNRNTEKKMASLNMAFGMAATKSRVFMPKATKNSTASVEEKGPLDWILGGMQKEDQLLETDPILNKIEEKNTTVGSGKPATSVPVPNKKKFGGFGGLFAKN